MRKPRDNELEWMVVSTFWDEPPEVNFYATQDQANTEAADDERAGAESVFVSRVILQSEDLEDRIARGEVV